METVFSRINILMLMEKVSVPKKIWPKFSRTLLFRSVWKEHKIMSNMTSIMLSHEIKEKSCTHNAQKDSFFYSQRDFFSFCYQLLYGSSYLFFFFATMLFYVFVLQNSMFLHLLQRSEEKRFLTERHTDPHFLCWISGIVPFNTWLILSWEENKCCYKLSKCTKWHLFHSKCSKLLFWVKIVVILSVAQVITTVNFFSAWDKSHVKWDNFRNSTHKMRTTYIHKLVL